MVLYRAAQLHFSMPVITVTTLKMHSIKRATKEINSNNLNTSGKRDKQYKGEEGAQKTAHRQGSQAYTGLDKRVQTSIFCDQ